MNIILDNISKVYLFFLLFLYYSTSYWEYDNTDCNDFDHKKEISQLFEDECTSVSYETESDNPPISITSFRYTRSSNRNGRKENNDFILRTVGSEGLYYNEIDSNMLQNGAITNKEINDRKKAFHNTFSLKKEDFTPVCYVSMMVQGMFFASEGVNYYIR